MNRAITCFAGLLLLLVGSVYGEINLTLLKGEAVNETKARLFLMVFDEAGRPVKGLSEEYFILKVDGEKITDFEIESVSATESPLSVVLGIDISGSMKGKPFVETQRSISRFLDQLDKKDYISLMTFGSDVLFLTGFTEEKYQVREKVEALSAADRWTHLYDATCEALEKVQTGAPTTKKAVVLLTDGKDTRSTKKRTEAVDEALDTGVPLFAIGFGQEIDREYLEEIARSSGGYFLYTPDPEEITKLYDKVLDLLKHEYAITFNFSKSPGKYRANLVLKNRDRQVESYKEFIFNPSGAAVIIRDTPPQQDAAPKSWIKKVPLEWVALLLVLMLVLIFAILWIRTKLTEKRFLRLTEDMSKEREPECELEFSKDLNATKAGFVVDFPGAEENGDATKYTEMPDVYLQVDCFRGRIIPLLYGGGDMLQELIIARKTEDGREKEYRKSSSVYLAVSPGKQVVSRPNENRCGHARIFHSGKEQYSIEDLGSKVGTFVNDKPIRGTGPVVLLEGDMIEIGGKNGIAIVFKSVG